MNQSHAAWETEIVKSHQREFTDEKYSERLIEGIIKTPSAREDNADKYRL